MADVVGTPHGGSSSSDSERMMCSASAVGRDKQTRYNPDMAIRRYWVEGCNYTISN